MKEDLLRKRAEPLIILYNNGYTLCEMGRELSIDYYTVATRIKYYKPL